MKTGLITHPIYLRHETGEGHPESPRRLEAILARVAKSPVMEKLAGIEPQRIPRVEDWIEQVHPVSFLRLLQRAVPRSGINYLDPDTAISPDSLDAAEMAVSGILTAVDRVMDGSIGNAFCAVRPPGHHAETTRAMGFCLVNNVAVAARYLQKKHKLKKIFIVDWDVHHGNGTQQIFYSDPTVFYFSTHQYPFYPGTGAESERGEGAGENFTLNCPLPAGSGDREILDRFEKKMVPALEKFKPDFILISAGFDAHRDDPLAGLKVTEEGFAEMSRFVKALAQTHCAGRLVSCLEGGYNLEALSRSVETHLQVLSQD